MKLRDVFITLFFLFTSQQLTHLDKLINQCEARAGKEDKLSVKKVIGGETLPIYVNGKQINLYQGVMWSLKAHEGFRETWYKDGEHKAIGFGFNHLGKKERIKEASKYMKNGKMDFNAATQLLLNTWQKKIPPSKLTSLQKLGWINHVYNCGSMKDGIQRCCGKKTGIGCGKGINSHNQRRQFEYYCWTNNVEKVQQLIIIYQKKASKIEYLSKSENE